jgi:6-phosphogluconate dehydrogenase
MKVGMVGLGPMGTNMVRRLLGAGHECVAFDIHPSASREVVKAGATTTRSLAELVSKLATPRSIWIMVPAAVVESTVGELAPLLAKGDTVIDGGNSYYHDDIRRAETLGRSGIDFVDVGTSGGVWGFERGYCLMIGGEPAVVKRLDGIFAALAPGVEHGTKPNREEGNGEGDARHGKHPQQLARVLGPTPRRTGLR